MTIGPKEVWRRERRRERHEQLRERIDGLLAKSRGPAPPSADVVAEMKMAGARVHTGYASVFGLPDYQGDIILEDAFDDWLEGFHASGGQIPLLEEHKWDDPTALRGWSQEVRADSHGLWVMFALLPEHGEQVLADVRTGRRSGLSIGHFVEDERPPTWPEREAGAQRVLTKLIVREVSLCCTPANTAARTYAVKSRGQSLIADVRSRLAEQFSDGFLRRDEQNQLAGRLSALTARAAQM
ncbi:hypothetical protein BH23GEM2_BH23GEM2_20910 [soil metagenome]